MAEDFSKRRFLLFLPALCGGLAAALPFKPPAKIEMVAILLGFAALMMLCLCLHDLLRRATTRPTIPLVWFCFSGGFGSLAVALACMVQTWGMRHASLPLTQITGCIVIGLLFTVVGCAGFAVACQKRWQPG